MTSLPIRCLHRNHCWTYKYYCEVTTYIVWIMKIIFNFFINLSDLNGKNTIVFYFILTSLEQILWLFELCRSHEQKPIRFKVSSLIRVEWIYYQSNPTIFILTVYGRFRGPILESDPKILNFNPGRSYIGREHR